MNESKSIVFTAPNQAVIENLPMPVPDQGQLLDKTRR